MAAFTRNTLLGGAGEEDSDDESIDFVPVSLTASKTNVHSKSVPKKSKTKEKKELKVTEKKQTSRLARHKTKQEGLREQERQAFEDSVSGRLSALNDSKADLLQMSGSERLDISGDLLNQSATLFEEVNNVTAPDPRLQEASKDDAHFSSTMSKIKAKKDKERQQERDAFLAAKQRRADKKRLKKKNKDTGSGSGTTMKQEEKEAAKREKKREKEERQKGKEDTKKNFKQREEEHKQYLKQKKKDKELEKEKAKIEKLVLEKEPSEAEAGGNLDGSSHHSRKRDSGMSLFVPSALSPKLLSARTRKTSTRIVGKLKPDLMSLWGMDSSSHHSKR